MGDYRPDTLEGRAVMRHETGHYVDARIAHWKRRQGQGLESGGLDYSSGPKGTQAMEADRKRLIDL